MKKYNTNQSKNDGEKMHLKKACDKQGVLKKFKSYKQYPPKYLILIAEEKKYISANKEEQDWWRRAFSMAGRNFTVALGFQNWKSSNLAFP